MTTEAHTEDDHAKYPMAMIYLVRADLADDDGPARFQGWEIPDHMAPTFATYMTETFGEPLEALSSVAAVAAASEGGPAVFTILGNGAQVYTGE